MQKISIQTKGNFGVIFLIKGDMDNIYTSQSVGIALTLASLFYSMCTSVKHLERKLTISPDNPKMGNSWASEVSNDT